MLFFNNIKAFRLCFILDHSVFKKIRKSLKSIVVLIVENISCWTVHKAFMFHTPMNVTVYSIEEHNESQML